MALDLIARALEEIPDYKVFMTLDELNESTRKLAEKHPNIVRVFEAGRSRDGREILAIKIGEGKNKACSSAVHTPTSL